MLLQSPFPLFVFLSSDQRLIKALKFHLICLGFGLGFGFK